MQYELERHEDGDGEPSLAEMTEKAIKILERSEKGYFRFVEGACMATMCIWDSLFEKQDCCSNIFWSGIVFRHTFIQLENWSILSTIGHQSINVVFHVVYIICYQYVFVSYIFITVYPFICT